MKVTLPVAPWDAPVATGAIQVQAGAQCGNGPIRDQFISFDQTRKPKYSVSGPDGNGVVQLIGASDTQKVPDATVDHWDGIEANASGAWFTKDQTVSLDPSPSTSIEVEMAATAFVNPFDPRCAQWSGFGIAHIKDPISVPILDDRSYAQIATLLPEGLRLAAAGTGVATQQFFAGTDLPGYETLYQLDIEVREAAGMPTLAVEFTSHQALGLDNQAIVDAVTGAFARDATNSVFELMSDVPLFSGDLELPKESAYNLFFDLRATAEANQGTVVDPPTQGPAAILSPVAVLGSDLGEYVACPTCGTPTETPLENMINQSGLDPFDSGVTPFDEYIQMAPPADGHYLNNWQSELLGGGDAGGYIDFDLGDVYSVDRLAIWNAKLDEVAIQIADSPDGPWQTVGEFQLDAKPGIDISIAPEVLLLDQAYDTRYLRIDVESVQAMGGPFGGDIYYAIVGEVAVGVRPIPEPISALLLAGLIATCYAASRRGRC